jgi:hypothetical protein
VQPVVKLVVLIVVVVALYVAALAYGFMRDDSDDTNETRPGIKLLGKWTAPFASRYDTSDLRCHGRLLAKGPRLTADKNECVLPINTQFDDDDRYRQVVLDVAPEPAGQELAVYVHAYYSKDDNEPGERDPQKCPLTAELPAEEFRLEVELEPIEDKSGKWDCWLRQEAGLPVRVTVIRAPMPLMPPFPSLTLRCVGCGGDPARTITLTN